MTPPPKSVAEDKPSAEQVAREKVTDPAPDQPAFTVERLRREGDVITGRSLHAVVGAFHEVPADEQVTVTEARKRVDSWLKAPVEQPPTE